MTTFNELMNQTAEDVKARESKIAERALRRELGKAYDSACIQEMEAQSRIDGMYDYIGRSPQAGVNAFSVNRFAEAKAMIESCQATKRYLANEFVALFGEEMPNLDEEEGSATE